MQSTREAKLNKLIPQYADNKAKMDELEKRCKAENAEIKSIMKDLVLQKHVVGSIQVTYSVQNKTTINEEALLDIIRENVQDSFGIIKTKEYVDYGALENAIYHNAIPKEILKKINAAKTVKPVEVLKVSTVKEKKDGKNDNN